MKNTAANLATVIVKMTWATTFEYIIDPISFKDILLDPVEIHQGGQIIALGLIRVYDLNKYYTKIQQANAFEEAFYSILRKSKQVVPYKYQHKCWFDTAESRLKWVDEQNITWSVDLYKEELANRWKPSIQSLGQLGPTAEDLAVNRLILIKDM